MHLSGCLSQLLLRVNRLRVNPEEVSLFKICTPIVIMIGKQFNRECCFTQPLNLYMAQ